MHHETAWSYLSKKPNFRCEQGVSPCFRFKICLHAHCCTFIIKTCLYTISGNKSLFTGSIINGHSVLMPKFIQNSPLSRLRAHKSISCDSQFLVTLWNREWQEREMSTILYIQYFQSCHSSILIQYYYYVLVHMAILLQYLTILPTIFLSTKGEHAGQVCLLAGVSHA